MSRRDAHEHCECFWDPRVWNYEHVAQHERITRACGPCLRRMAEMFLRDYRPYWNVAIEHERIRIVDANRDRAITVAE